MPFQMCTTALLSHIIKEKHFYQCCQQLQLQMELLKHWANLKACLQGVKAFG